MARRIWLTWERQRRNRTLSAAANADLYELCYSLPRAQRWFKAVMETIKVLSRERPQVVFAQNPSLLLALLAVWHGRLRGHVTIIDAHNAGIYPFRGRRKWHNRLLRPLLQRIVHHVMRSADLTLVSNSALQTYIENIGAAAFVLPDPLPSFPPQPPSRRQEPDRRVLFICTWADDEPYVEVMKAAEALEPGVQVLITGNSRGRERDFGRDLPNNVVLTGFVSEDEFVRLLHEVDMVMDLTTLENCLVCGAYEAVAAGTPLVLSGTQALRAYFNRGVVFTSNDAAGIAHALKTALADRHRLAVEIDQLRHELTESWQRQHMELEAWIAERVPSAHAAATAKSQYRDHVK